MTQNPPRSRGRDLTAVVWWGYKGFLCLSSFGGQSGPSYLGDGDKERRLMHQGKLALGDHVQLVVSDSLWPTGKKEATAWLSASLPAKAWFLAWLLHRAGRRKS